MLIFAAGGEFCFVGLGDGLGDGEADAVAAALAGAGGVGAVEAFEEAVEVAGGDIVAAVGDLKQGAAAAAAFEAEGDGAGFGGVFDGVVGEDGESWPNGFFTGHSSRRSGWISSASARRCFGQGAKGSNGVGDGCTQENT